LSYLRFRISCYKGRSVIVNDRGEHVGKDGFEVLGVYLYDTVVSPVILASECILITYLDLSIKNTTLSSCKVYMCYVTVMSLPKVFQSAVKTGIPKDVFEKPEKTNISVSEKKDKSASPALPSHPVPSPPVIPDDIVTGYLRDGVICTRGILRIGEILYREGQPRKIESVDFKRGQVRFLGDTP
jgi:hypothetical protein